MGIHAYQLNDKTMKYKAMTQSKRLHEYLELPGEFKLRYPQEIVFPNMDSCRMDELYLTSLDILVNLEEESGDITDKTLEKFAKYVIFSRFMYNKKIHIVVICHKDPGNEFEYFKDSSSLYIKVHYIYFSQDELWAKYENLINKIKQKIELTDKEALDMAFVSKFIDKKYKRFVIDSLTKLFNDAKINDAKLKMDVAIIIEAMIIKHIESEAKQNEFMERINMREYRDEMERIIYEEWGEELNKKDSIIEKQENEIKSRDQEIKSRDQEIKSQKQELEIKDKQIHEYQNKIQKLNNIKDKSSPEAIKIIESLLFIK